WTDSSNFRAPGQGLDWRWRGASYAVATGQPVRAGADPWVRRAIRLLRLVQQHPDRSPERPRDQDLVPVYQAWRLWRDGGPPRWYVKGRLLTFTPAEDTARACGLPVEVVLAFRAIYYDLPERGGGDYISRHAFPGMIRRQCFVPGDLEG